MRCRDRARTMLELWSGGDCNFPKAYPADAAPVAAASALASDEQERRELLDAISERLSDAARFRVDPAVTVSVRLLRHLATAGN